MDLGQAHGSGLGVAAEPFAVELHVLEKVGVFVDGSSFLIDGDEPVPVRIRVILRRFVFRLGEGEVAELVWQLGCGTGRFG